MDLLLSPAWSLPYTVGVPVALAGCLVYKILKNKRQDTQYIRDILHGEAYPLIMGHRAACYEAPENTLTAIKTAHKNGAKSVELDLEFTKDGVAVLLHDDTVNRTTNGMGKISDLTYNDISELNAAAYMNYSLTQAVNGTISLLTTDVESDSIPSLTQVLQLCRELNIIINLDVKSNARKTVEVLQSLYQKSPDIVDRMFITSFSPIIVYKVRRYCPEYLTGLIYEYPYFSYYVKSNGIKKILSHISDYVFYLIVHSWLPDFLGISFVSLNKKAISEDYCQYWRGKDMEVMAWTVNHPKEKQYLLDVLKVPIITDTMLNVDYQNK